MTSNTAEVVGITTTVPVEVLFAAGCRPCDLNNVFITSGRAAEMVAAAERAGFPENACAWNKGIYATAREMDLRHVVGVTEGDCSNTHALIEMLAAQGVKITPFAFPFRRDERLLRLHLEGFARAFGVTLAAAEEWKRRLDDVRALAHRIDRLTWDEGKVTGAENHLWCISCSDFFGDPDDYTRRAEAFLAGAERRAPTEPRLRLALAGIPPICDGIFACIAAYRGAVVFNEVPRQFAMPAPTRTLVEQYRRYTYPYDIFGRLDDIEAEVARRRIDGVIHYVQSFCFRQVQDVHLRRRLTVPVLTLECDRPGPLDGRTRTRLEAFLEMLIERLG